MKNAENNLRLKETLINKIMEVESDNSYFIGTGTSEEANDLISFFQEVKYFIAVRLSCAQTNPEI